MTFLKAEMSDDWKVIYKRLNCFCLFCFSTDYKKLLITKNLLKNAFKNTFAILSFRMYEKKGKYGDNQNRLGDV